jgi:predicted secreted protein
MVKKTCFTILFLLIAFTLSAGDIAVFLNLGFSEDSQYFMFGQYGVYSNTTNAYAEVFIVNVATNSFVPSGVIKKDFDIPLEPGNDGVGGIYYLLETNYPQIKKYNINHLSSGRFVYVLLNGAPPKSMLEFRDFNTGAHYEVTFIQSSSGTEKNVSASFYIKITVTFKNGRKENYTIGRPDYMRKGVKKYYIKYILLAPDSKSLVFVIEKHMTDASGDNIRYMVETKKIY